MTDTTPTLTDELAAALEPYGGTYMADAVRDVVARMVADAERRVRAETEPPPFFEVRGTACKSGSDGDCDWILCPQLRDDEPHATGRHCPLDRIGGEQ